MEDDLLVEPSFQGFEADQVFIAVKVSGEPETSCYAVIFEEVKGSNFE